MVVLVAVAAALPLFLSFAIFKPKTKEISFTGSEQENTAMATEIYGVKIERNPPESRLTELGVRAWSTYVTRKPLPFFWICFLCAIFFLCSSTSLFDLQRGA